MAHIFTEMKKMMRHGIERRKNSQHQMPGDKYLIFHGSEENFVRNGAWVLEESISLFHDRTNPIRHFSVDDLNNMNAARLPCLRSGFSDIHLGSWEGRAVLVYQTLGRVSKDYLLHEIVVAKQMVTHNNAHKILGCCLETDTPVVVYEWLQAGTLHDRMFVEDENQSKGVLEWKDRLRIAWEISHVVAYLHSAFPRPIIHRDLKPSNVLLDQDNVAKLREFGFSISIPEGESFVEDRVVGTYGFCDPEYINSGLVAESTDVYSFGMLFLVLLTGKRATFFNQAEDSKVIGKVVGLVSWVRNAVKDNKISDIVDPAITRNRLTTIEDLQLRASVHLSLCCVLDHGDIRPTMVEVATELKNMISSPESISTTRSYKRTQSLLSSDTEEVIDVEQEMRPVGTLIEAHTSIQPKNSASSADKPELIDPEPRDHVLESLITSIIEVEENEPVLMTSFGDIVNGVAQICDVQCSKARVILEELPEQELGREKEAKMSNNDEMIYTGKHTKESVCQSPEPLQYLLVPGIHKSLPNCCKELHAMMALWPLEASIAVGIPADFFQYHDTKEEFEIYVSTQDVVQILSMEFLNIPCLQIFTRCLQHKCEILKVDSIGFMCPKRLAMVRTHLTFTSEYMQYAIRELHTKSYLLGPYYQDNHWSLIVVCPQRHIVLFFDPMGKNWDDLAIKGHMNMAYRVYLSAKRSHRGLTWRLVQCPRQLNEVECGYYVMRYMYEIVTLYHQTDVNLEECFDVEPYTQQQINDVRDIWAKYFINECV